MASLIGTIIGEICTLLGFDNSDYRPVLCTTEGYLVVLVGYDGTNYLPLLTDGDGYLLTECVGAA